MPKMCQLMSPVGKNEPVFVNPLAVWYVRPGTVGHSVIHFAEDQWIGAAQDVNEVIRLLDVAMNVDHA
jgi:hypothetical protein